MSDFSDRPFVNGSLTGIRSFKVDSLGRLTGVSYRDVWRPGENIAQCNGGNTSTVAIKFDPTALAVVMQRSLALGENVTSTSESRSAQTKPRHVVGGVGCSCGYYAYFDRGLNPHHNENNAIGVIEGYGVTTVGTRGFRASKARLVALVEPRRTEPTRRRFDDLAAPLYSTEWPTIVGVLAFFAGLLGGILAVSAAGPWGIPAFLPMLAGAFIFYLSLRSITVHYGNPKPRDTTAFALVRRAYPDVPVYKSVGAALRAHPLTPTPPPELPSPASDPEFWTRSAS